MKIDHRLGAGGVAAFIARTGITGWYYRVLRPGKLAVGDAMQLIERPDAAFSIERFREIQMAHRPRIEAVSALAAAAGLSPEWVQRSTLEHGCYQAGLVPHQVMGLGTLDGILSCVAAGMGVTLLPRAVAEQHASSGDIRCHALPPELAIVKMVFIRRNDAFDRVECAGSAPGLESVKTEVRLLEK